MRKLAFLLAAIAAAVVVAPASADVARYQTQTATFNVMQPYGAVGQWASVWTHVVTVTINPCDQTFTGTAVQYDPSMTAAYTETVTGSLGAGTISIDFVRSDGVKWSLTNALFEPFVNIASSVPPVTWVLEAKVTPLYITATSDWKNHGQYVKAQGGGADAAHSCIGMPVTEDAGFTFSTTGEVNSASSTGTDVVLPKAGTYRIDVIGTWQGAAGTENQVDSEYLTHDTWSSIVPDIDQGDLQLNGQFVNWGSYSSYHAYTLALPLSGSVNLAVFDGEAGTNTKNASWYTDNNGSLSFVITYIGP